MEQDRVTLKRENTPQNSSLRPDKNQPDKRNTKSPEYERFKENLKKSRQSLVLWRRPFTTVVYFLRELFVEFKKLIHGILQHKKTVTLGTIVIVLSAVLYYIDGPHQQLVRDIEWQILWCGYWVGLGILSSVGLGTGLHTFLLYLGPHIASVTMAAWSCGSVDFPEPPYPQSIICPEDETDMYTITLWTIMNKVRLEACMWGLGTAIGELPPYFMARAARRSGREEDDEEYEELEAVLHSQKKDPLTRAKKAVHRLVERVGFFGILLCASIPNPLFDLAGITCGHFEIPFWTFFGATVIGKAIIKMHIQQLFVIIAFSKDLVEWTVDLIGLIPYIGVYMKKPFSDYLEEQKLKLHTKSGVPQTTGILQYIFGQVLVAMIAYFLISIIHSMAQNFAKREDEKKLHNYHKEMTSNNNTINNDDTKKQK